MSELAVANVFVDFRSNVRLVDLVGDGDHRLVVADMARKLIVYKVYHTHSCIGAHLSIKKGLPSWYEVVNKRAASASHWFEAAPVPQGVNPM